MQLCEYNGSEPVERDMDLIRELLLQIAANPTLDGKHFYRFDKSDTFEGHSLAEVTYHVNLLVGYPLDSGNAYILWSRGSNSGGLHSMSWPPE